MSENHPGSTQFNQMPGTAATPDVDGEMQTRIAAAPFQLSQDPVTDEHIHDGPTHGNTVSAPAYEHLGELPASYGTQTVYLVAYDPRQLFAYWDLDATGTGDKKFALHVCLPDGEIESKVDIQPAEAGRYLNAARLSGTYYVELGSYSRNGAWQVVATSGHVTLPAEGLAGETEPKFATLPFHLSFQQLMELIEGAMGSKEDLTLALARLQRGERPAVSSLLGALSHLSTEQLRTLEMILGQKFALDSQAGISPGGPNRFFRDRHEVLTSPSQSSISFSTGAGASEAVSSAGAFGSELLSSSLLNSEVTVKPLSSETLSSFSVAHGIGSETLASFSGGIGSEYLTSFPGLSSASFADLAGRLSSETFSSGGIGSESVLSLLAGLSSETLSSFFAAFAGGSEALSSGALGRPSSEAWRMAGGGAGLSSGDLFSSDRASMFLQAVESNLGVLGSLFSQTGFGSDAGFSPGGESSFNSGSFGGTGGSSESVAKKKSLW